LLERMVTHCFSGGFSPIIRMATAKTKKVCSNFQRGRCKFGDKCVFLHIAVGEKEQIPAEITAIASIDATGIQGDEHDGKKHSDGEKATNKNNNTEEMTSLASVSVAGDSRSAISPDVLITNLRLKLKVAISNGEIVDEICKAVRASFPSAHAAATSTSSTPLFDPTVLSQRWETMDNFRSNYMKTSATLADVMQKLGMLEEVNADLESKLRVMSAKFLQSEDSLQALERKLAEKNSAPTDASLTAKLQDLERQLNARDEATVALNERLEASQRHVKTLKESSSAAVKERDELRREAGRLESDISLLRAAHRKALQESPAHTASSIKSTTILQAQLDNTLSELELRTEEYKSERKVRESLEKRILALEAEVKAMNEHIREQETMMKVLDTENVVAVDHLVRMQACLVEAGIEYQLDGAGGGGGGGGGMTFQQGGHSGSSSLGKGSNYEPRHVPSPRTPGVPSTPTLSSSHGKTPNSANANVNVNAPFASQVRRPAVPFLRAYTGGRTRAEMAADVDEFVGVLKKRFAANGIELPLSKLSDCVYQLGKRKVHLSVQGGGVNAGGSLVVRLGGGWQSFYEFLDRARF